MESLVGQVLLMPGLDGTGDMFGPLLEAAPPGLEALPLSYPTHRALTYAELADWVTARLPAHPVFLIAESFSGPLALLVAQRCTNVAALVLCATFVEPPFPRSLAFAPRCLFRRRPSAALSPHLLTGGDAPLAHAAIASLGKVDPDVVASRIVEILTVDCREALLEFRGPLLYLDPTRERFLPRRAAQRIRQLRPDVEFRHIDGPHLLLQSNPRECWRHIVPFLASAGLILPSTAAEGSMR